MADEIDIAQANDEFFRDTALAEHFRRGMRNTGREAVGECVECGAEIPEARRKAVPGCRLCVQCQEQFETNGRVS